MKRTLISFAVLGTILGAVSVQAGGFDRSGQDTSIILKDGNLLEITSVSVSPSVTGTYSSTASGGAITNVAPSYSFTNLAFRTDISDDMDLAVIQDEPYGAQINWVSGNPRTGASAVSFIGVKADIKSSATTALVSYDVDDKFTVYGGLKSQSISALVANPAAAYYTLSTNTSSSFGYVVGAAFEKPEIAMRVALTYHSKVSHALNVYETNLAGSPALPNPHATSLTVESPEAYNLDFQTGIAENTLVFGTIRHVKWTQFSLKPAIYSGLTGGDALKDYSNNVTSYSIGLGRRFTDQWSGAVTYGSEAATGEAGSGFGPTDGYNKIGLGVTYTGEKTSVTLGMQKVNMGDTVTAPFPATMSGNTSLVTAVKIGYKF